MPDSRTTSRWTQWNERLRPLIAFLQRYGTRIWLGVIVVLVIYVVTQQQDELTRTWNLVVDANPRWVGAVLALEIVSFLLMAAVYGLVLLHLGHRVGLGVMISLHLQRAVVSGLTPMGGASSVLVFVHRLRQRGISPPDSILAAFIKSVSGHVAFLLILVPALLVERPTPLMLVSTACVLAMVIGMGSVLFLVARRKKLPPIVLRYIPRNGLRILAQLRQHDIQIRGLVLPLAYLVAFKLSGVLTLWFSLRAVGWDGGFVEPLTAYVVGTIFYVMAPIFQGLGVVEVGMALALQRLGVPAAEAIGATLIARVLGLWLPLLIGIVAQFLEAVWARRKQGASSPVAGLSD